MLTLLTLTDRDAEWLIGGCVLPNPSKVYEGSNYGQAKKEDGFDAANPSAIYPALEGTTNYGQYKKSLV